jgi:hypothetical protein
MRRSDASVGRKLVVASMGALLPREAITSPAWQIASLPMLGP